MQPTLGGAIIKHTTADLPTMEPMRKPNTPSQTSETCARSKIHGHYHDARVRKIGKNILRVIKECRVTNYFY